MNRVRKDIEEVEEQIMGLLGNDEDLATRANDLLDLLSGLHRERDKILRRRVTAQVEEQVTQKAERAVLGRFVAGRPNSRIVKAEAMLVKVGLVEKASNARRKAFDEALFELHVAHGYALSRALDLDGGVPAFQAAAVRVLSEMEERADEQVVAGAYRKALKAIRQLRIGPRDLEAVIDVGAGQTVDERVSEETERT